MDLAPLALHHQPAVRRQMAEAPLPVAGVLRTSRQPRSRDRRTSTVSSPLPSNREYGGNTFAFAIAAATSTNTPMSWQVKPGSSRSRCASRSSPVNTTEPTGGSQRDRCGRRAFAAIAANVFAVSAS